MGVKRINTVKTSNLPINITKERIHFDKTGISEKLNAGPIEPKPGPTSLIQVTMPLIDSRKPIPENERIMAPTTIITK